MTKLFSHLHYHWWKYCLIVLGSVLVWSVVFDTLGAPEKNEKIRITYIGDGIDPDAFGEALLQVLPSLTEQKIESLTVENPTSGISNDLYSVLATRVYGADFIIFEGDSLPESVGETYFLPLPQQMIQEADAASLYWENGIAYGFVLCGDGVQSVFSEFYSGDQRCCLFITHTSVNMGGLTQKGRPEDDAAKTLVSYLLESTDD